jgi:hypothetical protein
MSQTIARPIDEVFATAGRLDEFPRSSSRNPYHRRWLASALRGHYDYYAVPDNGASLRGFRWRVTRHWLRALRRRSQRTLSSACVSGQGIALLRVWPLRADRAVAGAGPREVP